MQWLSGISAVCAAVSEVMKQQVNQCSCVACSHLLVFGRQWRKITLLQIQYMYTVYLCFYCRHFEKKHQSEH